MKTRKNGSYVFLSLMITVFLMSACHREALENIQKDLDQVQSTLDDVNKGFDAHNKSLQESLAALNKEVEELKQCGNITIYEKVDFEKCIDHYADWEKQVTVNAKTKFPKAFHLNQKLIKAINCQVRNPVQDQKGIRVAMGLTEALTGNVLEPSKVVMLVFPLDVNGKKLEVEKVYGVSVTKGYHLPCPEWCD